MTRAAIAAHDHHDLMRRVTAAAVPRLGDWCVIYLTPEGASTAETAIANVDPAMAEWAQEMRRRFPFDPHARGGLAAVARTGTPELLHHIDEALFDQMSSQGEHGEPDARMIADKFEPSSAVTVPLRTKDGLVGAMQFITSEAGHRYDEDDLALADAVAGRVADALHATWMSDEQRRIATTLQRALLPPELPSIAGVDIAHRYSPAGTTSEVGGDFYDVFTLDELHLGHRHRRRAARHGADAAEVLAWTNDAVRSSDRHLFCTVGYNTLIATGGEWRLRTTLAGHPHPVVRRSDGTTGSIGVAGTLLGTFDAIVTTTVTTRLGVGDLVVFYTDGVTDLPAPYGITGQDVERLVARSGSDDSAERVADHIMESVAVRVPDASRRDDVALLVLRIEAPLYLA